MDAADAILKILESHRDAVRSEWDFSDHSEKVTRVNQVEAFTNDVRHAIDVIKSEITKFSEYRALMDKLSALEQNRNSKPPKSSESDELSDEGIGQVTPTKFDPFSPSQGNLSDGLSGLMCERCGKKFLTEGLMCNNCIQVLQEKYEQSISTNVVNQDEIDEVDEDEDEDEDREDDEFKEECFGKNAQIGGDFQHDGGSKEGEDDSRDEEDKTQEYQQFRERNGGGRKSSLTSHLPLMKFIQRMRNSRRKGCKILKEGWMVYFTDRNPSEQRYYWRLSSKSLTMYLSDSSLKYAREIPLSQIISIIPSTQNDHCFELKTPNLDLFCGQNNEYSRTWETSLKTALATGEFIPMARPPVCLNLSEEADVNDVNNPYTIFPDELLGKGHFGKVYMGLNRATGHEVAIKVIEKRRFPLKDEEALRNEVSILQTLNHPGIVRLERMVETSERIFVIMEKLTLDMLDLILGSEGRRLKERTAKFLIYQILVAVKYLHDRNIVHCDLKPENILLDSRSDYPQAKIGDFGFARVINHKSTRRSIVGTPAYLAPEVLKLKGYNRALDMWAIGVMIYVSLSGTFPYHEDQDINERVHSPHYLYSNVDIWKHVSDEAKDLIVNLLQIKIRKRYSVEDTLNHPWLDDHNIKRDLLKIKTYPSQLIFQREQPTKYEMNKKRCSLPQISPSIPDRFARRFSKDVAPLALVSTIGEHNPKDQALNPCIRQALINTKDGAKLIFSRPFQATTKVS